MSHLGGDRGGDAPEGGAYSRDLGLREPWSGMLPSQLPLGSGGSRSEKVRLQSQDSRGLQKKSNQSILMRFM